MGYSYVQEGIPMGAAPVIVIGMSRSGTTFLSELLHLAEDTFLAAEPHLIWKCTSWPQVADDRYSVSPKVGRIIRNRLLAAAGDRTLIEKSPPNVMRPYLVAEAFPDALVVLVTRDPARIIASNVRKTLGASPARARLIWQKHLRSASHDHRHQVERRDAFKGDLNVRSTIGLRQQCNVGDIPRVIAYGVALQAARLVYGLPFGPRPSYWSAAGGSERGLVWYYTRVLQDVQRNFDIFRSLYGDRAVTVSLSDLQSKPALALRIFEFCGLNVDSLLVDDTLNSIPEAIRETERSDGDLEITARKALEGFKRQA